MLGFLIIFAVLAAFTGGCVFISQLADGVRGLSSEGEPDWPAHDASWRSGHKR